MINTGGTFERERNIYFIASNVERMKYGQLGHDYLLVAINEVNTEVDEARLYGWLNNGKKVFIDSGVFNLTMEHARKHNVSMDIALGIPPDELDGFDNLFKKYIEIITPIKDQVWGYIEIDAGGREEKIKTRAKIEALGLNPIPVYHPLNDGWDYFDYLAERYDRICFGNIVQANRALRKRLVATLWERRKKYPNLWVHLLGLTPSQLMFSYPTDSADSSSWLSSVRWAGITEQAMGKSVGFLQLDYQYKLKTLPDSKEGSRKATTMSAVGSSILQRNWNNHLKRLEELGIEPYVNNLNRQV